MLDTDERVRPLSYARRGAGSAKTQKGTGIAASPHVTGLRPLIRKDRGAWFRRHAPLAPARACELRVGHRGRFIRMLPKKPLPFRPSAARFMLYPKARPQSLAGHDFPSDPSASAFACAAPLALGFSLRGDPSADLPLARTNRLRFRPSGRSFTSTRACAHVPVSGSARLRRLSKSPRRLRIALFPQPPSLSSPRSVRGGFPKAPALVRTV